MTTTKISMADLLDSLFTDFGSETQSSVISMFNKINIDAMTGDMLDYIGELVGQDRNNLNDAEYKQLLKARIAANSCSGLLSEIVNVVKLLTNSTYVDIVDNSAGVTIYIDGTMSSYVAANIDTFIQDILAEGVKFSGMIMYNDTNAFTFKSYVDADDSNKGFGDAAGPGAYGEFTYLI